MTIPDTELADLFLRVGRRLRRATALELEGSPVNPHQARALRTIARLEPVRMADLAERLHVAPRSATDVVEFLVAGGWVSRSPDPLDGRARLLSLTGLGLGLLAEVDAARARAAGSVVGPLTDDERHSVAAVLGRLAVTAGGRGGGDASPPPFRP